MNVNVTLLFAIERYEQVIDAFLRGLTARARGRRAARRDRVGRLVLRLSHRHQGRRAAARRLAAAGSRRDRQRARRLPALPDQVRRSGMGTPPGARSPDPASAVGQHRHQGPGLLRRALRVRADRTRRGQHDARADAARVRRPRRGAAHARRRPRGGRAHARRSRPPGSTSTHHRGARARGRASRSATPTTSCSTASRASSRWWPSTTDAQTTAVTGVRRPWRSAAAGRH